MTRVLAQPANTSRSTFPEFRPHWIARGGHAQTIAGRYLPSRRVELSLRSHQIALRDGDRLCVLVSTPPVWGEGKPIAVFVHGLGGCARADYVTRVADRLHRMGVRCVRMNLRGAGDGFGLARGIYHSGRTEDVRAVATWAGADAPGSPIALLGFSLGANLVLKLAAEARDEPFAGLDCVLGANPPLDLAACCNAIREPRNRLYDRNFVKGLKRDIARLHAAFPDLGPTGLDGVKSLYEFDDRYTSRRNGFDGAEDYYARSSAGLLVERIVVPGLVVHSADDPFIPVETVRGARFPAHVELRVEASGGHLGYLSARRDHLDRRWLDACLADWVARHWSLTGQSGAPNGDA